MSLTIGDIQSEDYFTLDPWDPPKMVSDAGGIKVLSGGYVWRGPEKIPVPEIWYWRGFTVFYYDGSGWVYTNVGPSVQTIPHSNSYNNVSTGLATMTANYYKALFVYIDPLSQILYYQIGQSQYATLTAMDQDIWNDEKDDMTVPDAIKQNCVYLGYVDCQKGVAGVPYSWNVHNVNIYTVGQTSEVFNQSHSILAGLGNDDHTQYYNFARLTTLFSVDGFPTTVKASVGQFSDEVPLLFTGWADTNTPPFYYQTTTYLLSMYDGTVKHTRLDSANFTVTEGVDTYFTDITLSSLSGFDTDDLAESTTKKYLPYTGSVYDIPGALYVDGDLQINDYSTPATTEALFTLCNGSATDRHFMGVEYVSSGIYNFYLRSDSTAGSHRFLERNTNTKDLQLSSTTISLLTDTVTLGDNVANTGNRTLNINTYGTGNSSISFTENSTAAGNITYDITGNSFEMKNETSGDYLRMYDSTEKTYLYTKQLYMNKAPSNSEAYIYMDNPATSYASSNLYINCATTSGTGWRAIDCYSASSTTIFYVLGNGAVVCAGDVTANGVLLDGADYAELIESVDATKLELGRCVVFDNQGKCRYFDSGTDTADQIIGVTVGKGTSSAVGNNKQEWWNKYLKTEFREFQRDVNGDKILNPDYDPNQEYIARADRDEWNQIAMVGQVIIRKTEVTLPTKWHIIKENSADTNLVMIR